MTEAPLTDEELATLSVQRQAAIRQAGGCGLEMGYGADFCVYVAGHGEPLINEALSVLYEWDRADDEARAGVDLIDLISRAAQTLRRASQHSDLGDWEDETDEERAEFPYCQAAIEHLVKDV